MSGFLHGVETLEVKKGAVPITIVRSAVVGLVGIAPKGPVNTLTLVSSKNDAEQFGSELDGFTIPQALNAIFAQGAGQVIVVNVLDAGENLQSVVDEVVAVASGKFTSEFQPVGSSYSVKNSAGSITYVEGTHYSKDDFGVFTILDLDTLPNGTSLKVSYDYLDTTTLTADQFVGTAGVSPTGLEAFALAQGTFGFDAKIFIAPDIQELDLDGVNQALQIAAAAYRGVCILDGPNSGSVAQVIAARGTAGSFYGWATSSQRTILAFPNVLVPNLRTGNSDTRSVTPYVAGVICAQDSENGYWWSPSNREIKGITSPVTTISASINDPNSEANQLNAAGIVTIFNAFGTGFRLWGNRNASFPSASDPQTFIPVRRTADVIHVSVEQAMLQFLDRPLNQAIIDAIRESVNSFIRTLIGRGALIDGVCRYDVSKNPPTELAAGHLTFDIDFMPPVATERITFESFINIDYLKNLK